MRYICLAMLVFAVIAVPVSESSAADVSMGVDVNSSYVWRGMTLNDGLVIQPSLMLEKNGFEAFLWGNVNISDYESTLETGEFSEIDIDVSYGKELLGLGVRLGVVQYAYPNDGSVVSTNGASEAQPGTAEVYASLGCDVVWGLSVGLIAYYDFDEVKDGYGTLTVKYETIFDNNVALTTGASIGLAGRDTTLTGEDGFHEYEVFAKAGYVMENGLGVNGHIAYTGTADEDVLAEQDSDVYGGVSLKYLF